MMLHYAIFIAVIACNMLLSSDTAGAEKPDHSRGTHDLSL